MSSRLFPNFNATHLWFSAKIDLNELYLHHNIITTVLLSGSVESQSHRHEENTHTIGKGQFMFI